MPTLKHIEVHIHQVQKQRDITLYTEQEEMKVLINRSLSKLIYLLEDKGYHLSRCSCQLALKERVHGGLIHSVNEIPILGIDFQV